MPKTENERLNLEAANYEKKINYFHARNIGPGGSHLHRRDRGKTCPTACESFLMKKSMFILLVSLDDH